MLKSTKAYIAIMGLIAILLLVCAVKISKDGQAIANNAAVIAQLTAEHEKQLEAMRKKVEDHDQKIADLENYNQIVYRQNEALNEELSNSWYLHLQDINREYTPTLVDLRVEKDLADLLVKHFEARYYGDKEAFDSTIINSGLMPGFFGVYEIESVVDEPYYAVEVRAILANDAILEINKNGGRYRNYISVLVLAQKTADSEIEAYPYAVGIEKHSGEWYITDYD